MENKELELLRYPIGKFTTPETITENDLMNYISDIERFPGDLRRIVTDLSPEQLDTQYRPKGWTVKQLIHHIADSHINAYLRFKLALTEDTPTIKPYFEDKWAELPDTAVTPVEVSLKIIEAIHTRWVNLLRAMDKKDFEKSFFHPEYGKEFSLEQAAAMYSWHGKHHFAHIKELKKRKGW